MKLVAIFAILVTLASAKPQVGEKEKKEKKGKEVIPGQSNPNAKRLGVVKLSDDAELEFLGVDETIVMSAAIPAEKEDLLSQLKDAEDETGGDPVLMYEKLTGHPGNTPKDLVEKWKKVKEAKKKDQKPAQSEPPKSRRPDTADEDGEMHKPGDGNRNLRGLSFYVLTGDWWVDNYCAEFRLQPSGCECYKWLTGDYYDWIYGTQLKMNLYAYYAPTGGVRHAVKNWVCNGGSCDWNLLWAGYTQEGYIGWATATGPTNYYGAFAEWANTDRYYWSMYEIDPNICNPPPGVWQSCAGVKSACPNRNFSV